MQRVALIGGYQQEAGIEKLLSDTAKYLTDALQKDDQPVEVDYTFFDTLAYKVTENSLSVFDLRGNRPLDDYSLLLFRGKVQPYARWAQVISDFAAQKHIPFANADYATHKPVGKLAQTVRFAKLGLPVPATLFGPPDYLAQEAGHQLHFPLVLKDDMGAKGRQNHLVKTQKEMASLLSSPMVEYVAQAFIPNDCDFRFLWVGEEALVIKRSRTTDTHLNNISEGATAMVVPLESFPPRIIEGCRAIMRDFGLSIAGIDLLYDPTTDQEYYLEVNRLPQLDSGAFAAEKAALLTAFVRRSL
jgi:glutathione synthase/RimK-type ligase-like ATP-grasp enzyme